MGPARSWRDQGGSPHGWLVLLGSTLFLVVVGFCLSISEISHPIHPHPSPSLKLHTASLSSLIVDQRAGLELVDGGFETVDLLIGGWISWVDHR